jgi:hypothetical protein
MLMEISNVDASRYTTTGTRGTKNITRIVTQVQVAGPIVDEEDNELCVDKRMERMNLCMVMDFKANCASVYEWM